MKLHPLKYEGSARKMTRKSSKIRASARGLFPPSKIGGPIEALI